MRRLATALVLVSAVLASIQLAPAWLFAVCFAAAIAVACHEAYGMLARLDTRPLRLWGAVGALAIAASAALPIDEWTSHVVLAGAVAGAVLGAIWTRPDPRRMLVASSATIVPWITIALLLSYVIRLRMVAGGQETGKDLVLLLLVCVAFGDTGAYYVGSAIGRHRMAPNLSPKKSWEGAIGGLAASVGGGVLAHFWFYRALPLRDALILGALLGACGILGDLIESVMKRATGTKDSSSLLPGHGGVFDRVDSLLIAAPVLFYYYVYVLDAAS